MHSYLTRIVTMLVRWTDIHSRHSSCNCYNADLQAKATRILQQCVPFRFTHLSPLIVQLQGDHPTCSTPSKAAKPSRRDVSPFELQYDRCCFEVGKELCRISSFKGVVTDMIVRSSDSDSCSFMTAGWMNGILRPEL